MAQIVDFRTVEKGFSTVSAAESAISGIGNAGKFATSIQGGIGWVSMNIGGVVTSIPDLRATTVSLQEQINALSAGGVAAYFRLWEGGEDGPIYGYQALRARETTSGLAVYQSIQAENQNHDPLEPDSEWWQQIAIGATIVGDMFEWLNQNKAQA
jgi:hypothetical protein